MTLEELLRELRYNILRDRSDLIQGDTDSLWDDETLLRYIQDAERRFARRAFVIQDATTPQYTQVKLKLNQQNYPLHPTVFGVMSARYALATNQMQQTGRAMLFQSTPPESLSFDPSDLAALPPGAPLAFFTDETLVYNNQQPVTFSVYPVPSAEADGQLVYLRVLRVPDTCYDKDHLDSYSQIPIDYQLDVLEWAAYRAQRTWDGDAGAPTAAEAHKARFEEAVVEAHNEIRRRKFANMSIAYGTNGWSYTR